MKSRARYVRAGLFPFCVVGAAAVLACSTAPRRGAATVAGVSWRATVAYEGESPFERIRAVRWEAEDPLPQAVGVDQGGDVVIVRMRNGAPVAERIYRHGCELTGLVAADVDPAVPGAELYVGGFAAGKGREGTGGAVVQLIRDGSAYRARRVYEGDGYVHAIEALPGLGAGLLVGDYAGRVATLTPTAAGPWTLRALHVEVDTDPEVVKVKDLALIAPRGGGAPTEAFAAYKKGRGVLVDLTGSAPARRLLDETGGLSRAAPDGDGGFYVTGYYGRVLRFVREDAGAAAEFRRLELHDEGEASGLRGIVLGRFPTPDGDVAPYAIHGFMRTVRLLRPAFGAYDALSIFRDVERGHALEAADWVPGNDADEIFVGGYSERMTLLAVER